MKITDLNGCEIEVTDLKEAICIAKRNTGYSHGKSSERCPLVPNLN